MPANDGEKLRVFHLLRVMSRSHRVTLVCRVMHQDEEDALQSLRALGIEVVGVRIAPPDGHLERLRWVAPFLLSRYPISLCTVYFPAIRDALRQLVAHQSFDVVQIEHSSLAIYLDHLSFSNDPARVVTMHNIDYVRNERIIRNTPFGVRKWYHQLNQVRFRRWELASVRRFHRAMVMSDVDAQILRRDVPEVPVDVVPNGVDCEAMAHQLPEIAHQSVVFVASMDSEANNDGALHFLDAVLPLLRTRLPELKVWMVGRQPSAQLQARHDGQQVFVTGKVDEVVSFYRQATVSVVPLRSGGGTRLKILEAMGLGIPVVSTSVGAEGIDLRDGVDALLADTDQAFADAVHALLTNGDRLRSISLQARALAEHRYDWRHIGRMQEAVHVQALART